MIGNHTPGPWIAEQDITSDGDTCWNVACNQDGFAHFIVGNEGLFRCDGSDEANARLIAAAPEMLNMLIELQESAQYWSEYGAPFNIVNRLNAVISKAKGEE